MSSAALRVLPYDEMENGAALLPTRLVRPIEHKHHSLHLIELKEELRDRPDGVGPRSLSRIVENNGEPPTFPGPPALENVYPNWLIGIFAAGVIVGVIGLMLVVLMAFMHVPGIGVASASCLVVGTTTVALSLLRGQDIEGFPN